MAVIYGTEICLISILRADKDKNVISCAKTLFIYKLRYRFKR